MPPTTSYSFGDVLLVPFPFTDQSTAKRRPAVVVSSQAYHAQRADLIIMAVTSQTRPGPRLGEVPVTDWKAAGLIKASVIKPILTTIERSLVIRRLGQLKQEDQRKHSKAYSTPSSDSASRAFEQAPLQVSQGLCDNPLCRL